MRDAQRLARTCATFVDKTKFWSNLHQRITLDNQLTVEITLGETALDLGYLQEAEQSLQFAQKNFPEYEQRLMADGIPIAGEVRQRHRRLNEAINRLHDLKEAASATDGVGLDTSFEASIKG